jgi:GNAT superfamily N-acetyltransferase
MNLRFLHVGPEGAEECVRLIRRSYFQADGPLSSAGADESLLDLVHDIERFRRRMDEGVDVLLARLDYGPAVGTVSYRLVGEPESVGWIDRLAVLPEYRGKGLGERIMRYVERCLREKKAVAARLELFARLTRLRGWYEQQGYRHVQTYRDGSALGLEIALMEKSLS